MVETCCNSDGTQLPALRARLREAREGTGEVLKVLQNAGFQIFVKGFTTLIVTCGRMGSWVKALEIFESMKSLGVEPNSYTYGALISVCYSAKQWERALELFYKMQEAGCAVDQLVFKHILPVCIKLGKFDLVLEFYNAMQRKAIELEVHTASAVLIACMRRRQWGLAADMLDRYHATGKVLSHRLYTQLIGACADHGDVDEAVEFFLMMQLVGVLPNSYSCQNMMRAIESAGEIELGADLWEQMRQARIFVSCETYNSLARLFARGHKWSKFLDVLSEMVHVGVDISVDSEEVIKRCYAEHAESSSLSASIAWKLKNLGIPVDLEAQDWMIKANMHSPAMSQQPWAAPYVRVA